MQNLPSLKLIFFKVILDKIFRMSNLKNLQNWNYLIWIFRDIIILDDFIDFFQVLNKKTIIALKIYLSIPFFFIYIIYIRFVNRKMINYY